MECALEFLIENAPTVVTAGAALSPQTYLPTIDFELHLTISLKKHKTYCLTPIRYVH